MEKLMYRVTEAAEILGLSRTRTYLLISDGTLASVKIDGNRRIRASDLRRYVESLHVETDHVSR
jgi:excisionase family DNA binding protein